MSDPTDSGRTTGIAFGRGIDWAISGILVVLGALMGLGGYLINQSVDRQRITDAIRDGEFQSDVLTEAEAIDITVALAEWGSVGLIAVGVLFAVVGIGFVFIHGRARKNDGRTPRWILGVVGASIGSLLSFIPLSPMIGGAAAGYLEPDESASGIGSGAIAGLVTMLPVLILSGVTGYGVFTTIDGELIGLAALFSGIVMIFALIYFVLLSAIGGFIGGKLR